VGWDKVDSLDSILIDIPFQSECWRVRNRLKYW